MKTIWACVAALCLSSCVMYYQKESVNTDNMAHNEIGQALAAQFPDIDEQELHDIVKAKIKSKYYSSKEFKQAAKDSGMVCNDKTKKCTIQCGFIVVDKYKSPYWTKIKDKTIRYDYTVSLDYSGRDAIISVKRHIQEKKHKSNYD